MNNPNTTEKTLEQFIERKEHRALLIQLPESVWRDYTKKSEEWLASKLQEVEITERAKHRDAGCRCGLCKQDIINMQISAQLKGEQNE